MYLSDGGGEVGRVERGQVRGSTGGGGSLLRVGCGGCVSGDPISFTRGSWALVGEERL